MRNVKLRQKEIDMILSCIGWANQQIKIMRDSDDEVAAEDDEGQT